jgi:hypothetical protein
LLLTISGQVKIVSVLLTILLWFLIFGKGKYAKAIIGVPNYFFPFSLDITCCLMRHTSFLHMQVSKLPFWALVLPVK